jgi:hypothetical protein
MKALILVFSILACTNVFAAVSGVFVVVRGKVFIQNLKKEVTQAKVKSVIYPGETVWTEADGKAKIVMSDRNVINVLPNTRLKLEIYTNEPNNKNVELQITEGRVRLDVQEKYDGKASKFEIKSSVAVAGIRGTELIFEHIPQSEANINNTSTVTVLTGKVQVDRIGTLKDILGFGVNGKVIVNSGQQLEVKKGASGKPVSLKPKAIDALKTDTEIEDDANPKANSNN